MIFNQFKENYKIVLNEQQEKTVQAVEGANLLLAVPGSGKTTVLIARLGYMICCKNIAPENILAITYTKAATEDMKRRFANKFGYTLANRIQFRTINGISDIIVKKYSEHKQSQPFELITDRNISAGIIKNILKDYLKEYPTENDIKETEILIAYIKNMMLTDEEISRVTDELPIAEIFHRYQEALINRQMMDYDDQLLYAYKILKSNSTIRNGLQSRYKYICVDEAQDTSKLQHAIIKFLVGENNNIFMVGDEDQSIYGFRAAYPKALTDFKTDYKDANILYMESNYRSTVEIIEKAANFIKKNEGRYDKNIVATRGNGEPVTQIPAFMRDDQYRKLLEIAKNSTKETAILYRDNDCLIPLVDLFLRNDVPFCAKKVNGTFFTNKLVTDMKDFLQFTLNPKNEKIFMRIYFKCGFGFNKQTAEWSCQRAQRENITIPQALILQLSQWKSLRNKAREFNEFIIDIKNNSPYEALQSIHFHYASFMRDNNLDYGKYEILCSLARQEDTIKDFLIRLDKLQEIFQNDETIGKEGIILSTIHSSKGLEYDTVYLMDVYDGIFPSISLEKAQESFADFEKYQEERRLFYVAMTRAKNKLNIFTIKTRNTSFCDELFPPKVVEPTKPTVTVTTEVKKNERERAEETRFLEDIVKRNRGYEEIKDSFIQQHTRIIDSFGQRWVKCELCGEIKSESEFSSYGGANHVNLGVCKVCSRSKH